MIETGDIDTITIAIGTGIITDILTVNEGSIHIIDTDIIERRINCTMKIDQQIQLQRSNVIAGCSRAPTRVIYLAPWGRLPRSLKIRSAQTPMNLQLVPANSILS